MEQPKVVIIGGGFGGLYAARSLRKAAVDVTLVDRRNHHLFQPLLYQVATGGLSPANISAPLRSLLRKQKNCEVLLGEVTAFDPENRKVLLKDGELDYEWLIIAAGATNNYFGNDKWGEHALGLKSLEEATEIRRRVLTAFEMAERERDLERQKQLLTFVVIGGGPTGVELAGALAEVAYSTLRRDFRHFDPHITRIILLEAGPRLLPPFPEKLSARAEKSLEALGVEVRTSTMVKDIQEGSVTVRREDQEEVIQASVVLWGAGVRGTSLSNALAEATGVELDRANRALIDPQLRVPGHPNIFVIGDMANYSHQDGKPLPGVAPVAMQQGRYVAQLIQEEMKGRPMEPFRYKDKGSMATIGRARAVVDLGFMHISGYLAWLMWLFVHLMYLVAFENRLLVLMQWAWNYITRNRSARLITETSASAQQDTSPGLQKE